MIRLLVLDEIDQLDSKHQDVLYRIFEWPALKDSKLILVGESLAIFALARMKQNVCKREKNTLNLGMSIKCNVENQMS